MGKDREADRVSSVPTTRPLHRLPKDRTFYVRRDYDLVVIGGGAGGLVAAREARRHKASVVIVQDGPMGGDCTHTGCVPSKALLAAAARGESFREAMAAVHRAVAHIAATEDAAALHVQGIDVIAGYARFQTPSTIDVDGTTITSKRFVVATGATAMVPPIPGLRELPPLTNETLFSLTTAPTSLAVLGGGPIGCEMAQAFARLGTKVTIIEALDRLLPREEPEASAVIADALRHDGVAVRVGSKVVTVERGLDGQTHLHFDGAEPVVAEQDPRRHRPGPFRTRVRARRDRSRDRPARRHRRRPHYGDPSRRHLGRG